MNPRNAFYLTTPIYYVNDKPHVGHAYTTIVADVIARYRRLAGQDVFFLTGTDENSQKNVESAEKAGESVQTYVDKMSARWRKTFVELDIGFDDFVRTTEERHKKGVEKFWRAVLGKGDIYLGDYEGLYCTGCESFKTSTELTEGLCPLHKRRPEVIKEKNYFFRLSAYRDRLLAHIDANPDFIGPESRRNEVRSYVAGFMADISISRESAKWGIGVPDDPKSVVYVWFDALINYLTGIGYGTDEEKFRRYWPADLHIVGKDIIKFHCALWPAMLMSAGLPLPKKIFAHGYFTINGEKMSKSLGNVVDPVDIAARYGNDSLRFFLLREIPFGEDGDFSEARLAERYAGDLANELGNLLHRVLSMTEKYFDGKIPSPTEGSLADAWSAYESRMNALDFGGAIDAIWRVLRDSNKFIDTEQPWALAKTDRDRLGRVIYILLERLRAVAWLIRPILPQTSEKMFTQLGITEQERPKTWSEAKNWGGLPKNGTIAKGAPLFPRLS